MAELKKEEFKTVGDLEKVPGEYFRDNQSIERINFKNIQFESFKFSNSLIRNCSFIECSFSGSVFDHIDLQRVNFTNCTFSNCDFSVSFRFITGGLNNCTFSQCDFSNSFIQNTKWTNTSFDSVDFKKVKTKSISFGGSKFGKINFDGSNIVRGDFSGVSGLSRSLFYQTTLDDCTFDWNEAFIIMEFGKNEYDNLYKYGIKEVLDKKNITPKRVDQYEFQGRITDEILQNIITSKLVIAECSATNKNVYFEVGYALGNNKKVIFLIDDASNIPFDLKDYSFIVHGNSIDTLKEKLEKRVDFYLESI